MGKLKNNDDHDADADDVYAMRCDEKTFPKELLKSLLLF